MKESADLAAYYFHQGTNYFSHEYLGCHLKRSGDEYRYTFRTWAPSCEKVELISEFSGWDTPVPFKRVTDKGIWELEYISQRSLEKCAYKFKITSDSGSHNKGDPFAAFSRGMDDGASLIFCESDFAWSDRGWMNHRNRTVRSRDGSFLSQPVNIYEIHLGSFMQREDGTHLSYRDLADVLVTYVKGMGYTHVELLPITEHPYGGSWGYQVGAYFAPTSRYGDPDDFRYFVNTLHKGGVGVILDWVPAHFPKDEWGLYEFDGGPLYEYQGKDRMESRSWGTRFFDLGREEVQSFLISSAVHFLKDYHVDGLRVDAVASMLYLDYDRSPGEWFPNYEGTNLNLEAVAFFKKLNTAISERFPSALMIAEESGSYGKVTVPVDRGGLGFGMKWNMGFANDFYDYAALDPVNRKDNHKALNFPIMYAFSENYCLPISHDEVVHGKKSFVDKFYGEVPDKLSQMRAALLLIMSYPGKKLMFMGTEYAQFREWDYTSSLEWFMLNFPEHYAMREYVRSLNRFYLSRPEMWEQDFDPSGFSWILPDESDKNSVIYRRIAKNGFNLIFAINFSGSDQFYRIPTQPAKSLECVFATHFPGISEPVPITSDGAGYYASFSLPRFSGVVLREKNGNKIMKI